MLLVGIALCVHTRGKNGDKRPPRLGLGYDDSSNPGRKRQGYSISTLRVLKALQRISNFINYVTYV